MRICNNLSTNFGRRTPRFVAPWGSWRGRLLRLRSAVMLTSVLCAMSCTTQRQVVSEVREVSLNRVDTLVEIRTEAVSVPESSVQLALTDAGLSALPEGASYRAKDGQASVSVSRKGDTIYVDAECDSLLLVAETYYRRARALHDAVEQFVETESKETQRGMKIPFVLGFVVGALVGGLIIKKLK